MKIGAVRRENGGGPASRSGQTMRTERFLSGRISLIAALVAGLCWQAGPGASSCAAQGAALREVAVDGERLTIRVEGKAEYSVLALPSPPRLVVDLYGDRKGEDAAGDAHGVGESTRQRARSAGGPDLTQAR